MCDNCDLNVQEIRNYCSDEVFVKKVSYSIKTGKLTGLRGANTFKTIFYDAFEQRHFSDDNVFIDSMDGR